jgi:hypothetical protein
MPLVYDREDLVGGQVLEPRVQGVRNLDPLMGRVDVVLAEDLRQVVTFELNAFHTLIV